MEDHSLKLTGCSRLVTDTNIHINQVFKVTDQIIHYITVGEKITCVYRTIDVIRKCGLKWKAKVNRENQKYCLRTIKCLWGNTTFYFS